MKAVSIIRDRGQLTIPDTIRKKVSWAFPMSPVLISVEKDDKIVISPHQVFVDTSVVWEKIKNSRSIIGKGSISAQEFIRQDRDSR